MGFLSDVFSGAWMDPREDVRARGVEALQASTTQVIGGLLTGNIPATIAAAVGPSPVAPTATRPAGSFSVPVAAVPTCSCAGVGMAVARPRTLQPTYMPAPVLGGLDWSVFALGF